MITGFFVCCCSFLFSPVWLWQTEAKQSKLITARHGFVQPLCKPNKCPGKAGFLFSGGGLGKQKMSCNPRSRRKRRPDRARERAFHSPSSLCGSQVLKTKGTHHLFGSTQKEQTKNSTFLVQKHVNLLSSSLFLCWIHDGQSLNRSLRRSVAQPLKQKKVLKISGPP